MVDPKPLGSLDYSDVFAVHNALQAHEVYYPVLMSDDLPSQLIERFSSLDDFISHEIELNRLKFSIAPNISYCFLSSAGQGGHAIHLGGTAKSPYCIAFHLGIMGLSTITDAILSIDAIRTHIGLQTRNEVSAADDNFIKQVCARTLVRWLACHEVAHIKNGHLHLSRERAFGAVASEILTPIPESEQDKKRTLQTLEFDADSFAHTQSFDELHKEAEKISKCSSLHPTWAAIRLFEVCVFALLRSFDRYGKTISASTLFHFSHPPLFFRAAWLPGTWMAQFFSQFTFDGVDPTEPKKLIHDFHETIMLVERHHFYPAGYRMSEQLRDIEPEELRDYADFLLKRWAKIRNDLETNLLGGTLSPAQLEPA